MENLLNEGDTILVKTFYYGWNTQKVARVTATQAILDNGIKLRRDMRDGDRRMGDGGYACDTYYRNTPETRKCAERDNDRKYATYHKLATFMDSGKGNPSPEKVSKIVAIHKKAMAEINEILKSE